MFFDVLTKNYCKQHTIIALLLLFDKIFTCILIYNFEVYILRRKICFNHMFKYTMNNLIQTINLS